ncbi:zinc ribbon domain-containing protein [Cellulomonas aerilata]|uniref:Zinc ribbon domain-containing protein n=1 Tax=Cellulomonas aerilata TaxID=515326 RepID=A0A512D9X8_9CELL|nr:zinc ribbon domain-containing protein [Cellulomonas aerilata]GEO33283.1 hypothetical protein CAE01nite_10080 [Cellulomonas aerilata]
MIICASCTARNEDGESFCGQCGAYLEWEGQRVDAPPVPEAPPPAPEPTPPPAEPEPERHRIVDRILSAAGRGGDGRDAAGPGMTSSPAAGAPSVDDAPAGQPVDRGAAVRPGPGAGPGPAGGLPPAPVDHGARREHDSARRFGVAKPTERDESPAPASPPPPPDDEPPPAPGELICGNCGAGNVPTRKFCRRCGRDLADAPVAVRPPWWRRLGRRRTATVTVAGTRPTTRPRRHVPTRSLVTLLVVAGLGVGGWLARDALRTGYAMVSDAVTGVEAVRPAGVAASAEQAGREARLAVDGVFDRSWSPGAADTALGQSLQLAFDEPFRLVYVLVTPGASRQQEQFLLEARPRDVVVTATRSDGTVLAREFALADEAGEQTLRLGVDDVTAVALTIGSVHPAQDPAAPVAVGEVEIFGRR